MLSPVVLTRLGLDLAPGEECNRPRCAEAPDDRRRLCELAAQQQALIEGADAEGQRRIRRWLRQYRVAGEQGRLFPVVEDETTIEPVIAELRGRHRQPDEALVPGGALPRGHPGCERRLAGRAAHSPVDGVFQLAPGIGDALVLQPDSHLGGRAPGKEPPSGRHRLHHDLLHASRTMGDDVVKAQRALLCEPGISGNVEAGEEDGLLNHAVAAAVGVEVVRDGDGERPPALPADLRHAEVEPLALGIGHRENERVILSIAEHIHREGIRAARQGNARVADDVLEALDRRAVLLALCEVIVEAEVLSAAGGARLLDDDQLRGPAVGAAQRPALRRARLGRLEVLDALRDVGGDRRSDKQPAQ